MTTRLSVLFVCLGNICRSPLAEAAFRAEASTAGLDIESDSAGTTDWHSGYAPDPRAQAVALRHGIDIGRYCARRVTPADFIRFSHIVAVDHEILAELIAIRPESRIAELSLLLDHVKGREAEDIADPYVGDERDFEATWADVTEGARALVVQFADNQ